MNTISYLKEIYGYGVPIFLKDIRIGQKSKLSIRKDLSRGVEKGDIIRKGQGVYCFKAENEFNDSVTFEEIISKKFIKNDYGIPGLDLDIFGYYSGLSFLNLIGISQQVPAILEVVTNKTSCKRVFKIKNRSVIIRPSKIPVNRFNYKALQFFDLFYLLSDEEIKKHRVLLADYVRKNITRKDIELYLFLYPAKIINRVLGGRFIHEAK